MHFHTLFHRVILGSNNCIKVRCKCRVKSVIERVNRECLIVRVDKIIHYQCNHKSVQGEMLDRKRIFQLLGVHVQGTARILIQVSKLWSRSRSILIRIRNTAKENCFLKPYFHPVFRIRIRIQIGSGFKGSLDPDQESGSGSLKKDQNCQT